MQTHEPRRTGRITACLLTVVAPAVLFAFLLMHMQPSPIAVAGSDGAARTANTLTVRCTGSDYTSIQIAVNHAIADDVIEICAGVYDESVDLSLMGSAGTTATGNITLRGIGMVVISPTAGSAIWDSIAPFEGNITIENINATTFDSSAAINLGSAAIWGRVTMIGGSASDAGGSGLRVDAPTQGVVISGTTFENNGEYGVYVYATGGFTEGCGPTASGITIAGATATNNHNSGFYLETYNGDVHVMASQSISNDGDGFEVWINRYQCADRTAYFSDSRADLNRRLLEFVASGAFPGAGGTGFNVYAPHAEFVNVSATGNAVDGISHMLYSPFRAADVNSIVPISPTSFSIDAATVRGNLANGVEVLSIDMVTATQLSAISNTEAGLFVGFPYLGNGVSAAAANHTPPAVINSVFTSNGTGIATTDVDFRSSVAAAQVLDVPTPNVYDNVICNNTIGLASLSGAFIQPISHTLMATGNYWGSFSGPAHSSNPSGTGNPVYDAGFGNTPIVATASTDQTVAYTGTVVFAPWVDQSGASVVPPGGLPGEPQSVSFGFFANGSAAGMNGPGDPANGTLFTLATNNGVVSTNYGSGASVPASLVNGLASAVLVPATSGQARLDLTGPCGLTATTTVDVLNPVLAVTKSPPVQAATAGSTVTFTIAVTNTGTAPLINVVAVDDLAPLCSRAIGALAPSETIAYTCAQGPVAASFTNAITVTAEPQPVAPTASGEAAAIPITATASSEVVVFHPGLSVIKTAGTDPNACALPGPLTVPISSSVYFCIAITNIGDITLTDHIVTDAPLGIFSVPVPYPLAPLASVVITRGVFPPLGPIVVTGPLTNTVAVTSSTVISAIGVVNVPAVDARAEGLGTVQIVLQPTGIEVGPEPDNAVHLYLPTLRR